MCNCKDCKGITLLSGTDGRGIVSITYDEITHEITVLYTDGTSYTSPSVGCDCPTNVFYSENALGVGSTGAFDDPIIIPSTTYTVPTGGDGEYRIMYTLQANIMDVPGGTAEIFVKLLVNGSTYPIYRRIYAATDPAISDVTLNYQVDLVAGDVVEFEGTATEPDVQYLSMAVLIIDKMP
jgi:hypothetical protein